MGDRSVAHATFVIDWDNIHGPGSVAERRLLQKADTWSKEKVEWCCREKGMCNKGSHVANQDIDCERSDVTAWTETMATWCCKYQAKGCRSSNNEFNMPAALSPIDPNFDASPHSGPKASLAKSGVEVLKLKKVCGRNANHSEAPTSQARVDYHAHQSVRRTLAAEPKGHQP